MVIRHIKAILKKQIFDTAYNKSILIQCLLYPTILLFFLFAPISTQESKMVIVRLFSSMIIGSSPIIIITNIIREDKRSGALRMMILSNVKAIEYLIGITLYVSGMLFLTSILVGLIVGFSLWNFIFYISAMLLAIISTVFLGSFLAIRSKNSASASLAIIVISIFNGYIPIISQFYPSISSITHFWYTQAIADIICDLYNEYYLNIPDEFLIILIHMMLFLGLFVYMFKHNKLLNEE